MTRQWLREYRFIAGDGKKALDLSKLRIVFDIQKNDNLTPNSANVKIYNLSDDTANRIIKQFTRVRLEAGYQGDTGLIYQGTVIQIVRYRAGVDSVLEFIAGDGDLAYTYGFVNCTQAAGARPIDSLRTVRAAVSDSLIEGVLTPGANTQRLPRGKVFFTPFKTAARKLSRSMNSEIYMDSGKLMAVPHRGYLPKTAVYLSPETGLIGTAKQTIEGVECQCLLNHKLTIGALIRIDEEHVQQAKLDVKQKDKKNKKKASDKRGGFYRLISCRYRGDSRGKDWYCDLKGVLVDAGTKQTKDGEAHA